MITVQILEDGQVVNQFQVEGNQTQATEEDFPEYLQEEVGAYLAGQEEMTLEEYLRYQAGTIGNKQDLLEGDGIKLI